MQGDSVAPMDQTEAEATAILALPDPGGSAAKPPGYGRIPKRKQPAAPTVRCTIVRSLLEGPCCQIALKPCPAKHMRAERGR